MVAAKTKRKTKTKTKTSSPSTPTTLKATAKASSTPTPTPTSTSKDTKKYSHMVDPILLQKAISSLMKHHKATKGDQLELLGNDETVHVQFTLTRIPEKVSSRPVRISIPHSLHKIASDGDDNNDNKEPNLSDIDVCLIVKDEAKEWIQELTENFPKEMSSITKILTLTSLRKKFSQYKDKRELLKRYDIFLADDRILPMLGKNLGKHFFAAKKQPIPLKMTRKEALPYTVQRALKSTYLYSSPGTCLAVKAATTAMDVSSIVDNVHAILEQAVQHIPKKWANVSAVNVKTTESIALPVYNKTREELMEIAKIANVTLDNDDKGKKDSKDKKGNKGDGLDSSKKNAKRTREQTSSTPETTQENDDKVDKEEVKNNKKTKKQKKEQAAKSPLLQALKKVEQEKETKAKNNDQDDVKSSSTNVVDTATEEKQNKKSKKKRKTTEDKKEVSSPVATTSTKTTTPKKEKADFIKSKKFKGSKKGYVFKMDKEGLGYYMDVKPVPDTMAIEALSRGRGAESTPKRSRARSSSKGRKSARKGRR